MLETMLEATKQLQKQIDTLRNNGTILEAT